MSARAAGPSSRAGRHRHPTSPVYLISVVAELTGLHPQTLRQYDRLGLVDARARRRGGAGATRRWTSAGCSRVVELTRDGVNLEGVRRILELEEQIRVLRSQLGAVRPEPAGSPDPEWADLPHLPVPLPATARSTASLVVWRRRRG